MCFRILYIELITIKEVVALNWLNKLERKFGRYAIRDLMKYIVFINGAVFLLIMLNPSIINLLLFSPSAVMRGEIWRVITFIFIPPSMSVFWVLFALYFYYMIGMALENEWGSFRFNMYYLLGMLGTILAGFITGGVVTPTYVNLSLFLAFAYIYPNYEILLFFILPIKIKYLAYINWIVIAVEVITRPVSLKAAAIMSVINFFIFFGRDIFTGAKGRQKAYNSKRKFKSQISSVPLIHRCTVCGISDKDDPNMEFRYCSKCEGTKCYCMNHIKNHEHIVTAPEDKIIEFKPKDKEN